MKTRVLFEDSAKIRSVSGYFERAEEELNQLNDFLTSHKLGPLTRDMVAQFTKNPNEALRDIYKAKIPAVNEYTGLKNNKDDMLQQMELPPAPRADSFIHVGYVINELDVFDYGKKVTINDERLQNHLDRFRYITADPKTIEAYEDFKALAEQMGKMNDRLHFINLNGSNMPNFDYRLGDIIPFTANGFKVSQTGFMVATGLLRK
jgi:hypothetical protein